MQILVAMSLLLIALITPSLSSQIKPDVYLDQTNRMDITLDDGTEVILYGAITEHGKKKKNKYYYLPSYLNIEPNNDKGTAQMAFSLNWELIEDHESELRTKLKAANEDASLIGVAPLDAASRPVRIKGRTELAKALKASLETVESSGREMKISFQMNPVQAKILKVALMNPMEMDKVEVQFSGFYHTLLYSPSRQYQAREIIKVKTYFKEGLDSVGDLMAWIEGNDNSERTLSAMHKK